MPLNNSCVINNAMWKKRSIKDRDHRPDLPLRPDHRTPDSRSDSISADRSSRRHCSTDLVHIVGPMMLRHSRSRRLCQTIDRSAPPAPAAPSRRQHHNPRHRRRSRQPTIQNPIMTPSRIRSLIAAATDRCRRRPHDAEGYAVAHELAPSHPAPRAASTAASDQTQFIHGAPVQKQRVSASRSIIIIVVSTRSIVDVVFFGVIPLLLPAERVGGEVHARSIASESPHPSISPLHWWIHSFPP